MKARYVLILTVVLAASGIVALHSYDSHAGELSATLLVHDTQGVDITVEQQQLQSYTHKHMGTSQTIFLQGSYDRAVAAAQAASGGAADGAVYAAAQAACGGKTDSITQAKCVQAYVDSHSSAGANPQQATLPNKDSFMRSYAAPTWTADLTGLLLASAVLSGIVAIYTPLLRRR